MVLLFSPGWLKIHYVGQAGFEHSAILSAWSPEYWSYKHEPSHPAGELRKRERERMHLCMFVWVYTCAYVCTCLWRSVVNAEFLPQLYSILFCETGFFIELAKLTGQQTGRELLGSFSTALRLQT